MQCEVEKGSITAALSSLSPFRVWVRGRSVRGLSSQALIPGAVSDAAAPG